MLEFVTLKQYKNILKNLRHLLSKITLTFLWFNMAGNLTIDKYFGINVFIIGNLIGITTTFKMSDNVKK